MIFTIRRGVQKMTNSLWKPDERVNAKFDVDDSNEATYRYTFSCAWDDTRGKVTFVMLNPSTADKIYSDPTLRRCANFSKSWGYGGFYAVNLFAYRATSPKELKNAAAKGVDLVGKDNDRYIIECAKKGVKVVFSWGQSFKGNLFSHRVNEVRQLLPEIDPYCIELTKDGIPRHPLMLKAGLGLKKFI